MRNSLSSLFRRLSFVLHIDRRKRNGATQIEKKYELWSLYDGRIYLLSQRRVAANHIFALIFRSVSYCVGCQPQPHRPCSLCVVSVTAAYRNSNYALRLTLFLVRRSSVIRSVPVTSQWSGITNQQYPRVHTFMRIEPHRFKSNSLSEWMKKA